MPLMNLLSELFAPTQDQTRKGRTFSLIYKPHLHVSLPALEILCKTLTRATPEAFVELSQSLLVLLRSIILSGVLLFNLGLEERLLSLV
jgi:hypothetical protein